MLTAQGDRAFCGGIDLRETANDVASEGEADLHSVLDPNWEWRQTQYSIRECLVPVVGAIERPAIGAGFGLVGVCDLVIAGEDATFGLTEINVGLLGGASKALRLLGPSKARRMLFLGQLLAAQELGTGWVVSKKWCQRDLQRFAHTNSQGPWLRRVPWHSGSRRSPS